jgi:hypothetical protein
VAPSRWDYQLLSRGQVGWDTIPGLNSDRRLGGDPEPPASDDRGLFVAYVLAFVATESPDGAAALLGSLKEAWRGAEA